MDFNFLKNRLSEVVHTTALEPKKSDFLATHVPFKNLRYVNSGLMIDNSQANEISEEEFLSNYILDNRDKHNFIVVQGDNGSGKSHFIRWLKHRYENEIDTNEDVVVIISRGQNTLKGALEQIIKSDIFNDVEKNTEIRKIIEANDKLNRDEVREQVTALMAAETKLDDDTDEEFIKPRYKKLLYSFLVDPVIQEHILFKKNGPIERILSKLVSDDVEKVQNDVDPRFAPEDFEITYGGEVLQKMQRTNEKSADSAIRLAEALANERKGEELRQSISNYLNSKVDRVIQKSVKLSAHDLRDLFQQIRTHLKDNGKNLSLFIEDITSFAGIDKSLIETLLIDHVTEENSHLCRLISVIGVTNSYYNDYLPENIKERVTGRIIIQEKSLISSKYDLCEMAGRYINAINLSKEELDSWLENGARDSELPISKANFKHEWSKFTLNDGRTISLYPFNDNALWNMYEGLKSKTPRSFLQAVLLNVLTNYFYKPEGFPPTEKEFVAINIPKWENPLYEDKIAEQSNNEKSQQISVLLRLWGDCTIYKEVKDSKIFIGGVSEDIFKEFKLPLIDGVPGKKNGDETIFKERIVGNTKPIKGNTLTTDQKKVVTNKSSIEPSINSTEERKEREFNKYYDELEKWREGGDLISHKVLREDLCDVIKEFINWEEEGISPLFLKYFVTISNFHIEGQNVKITSGFIMKRDYESFYILVSLISWKYKGNRSWNFPNSEEYVLRLTNYLLKHKEEIIKIIKYPIGEDISNWNYEQWALTNEYYIKCLSGEIDAKESAEQIFKKLFNSKLEVESKVKHESIWNSLLERLATDIRVSEHHDQLVRYYNKILGDAKPESTKTFFLDTYEVLRNIDNLKKISWNLNSLASGYLNSQGTTGHYLPITLLKEYFNDKIRKLISQESSNIVHSLSRLEDYFNSNLTVNNVDKLNLKIKSFLNDTLYSIRENYNITKFQPLFDNKFSGQDIVDAASIIKNIDKLSDVDKIILLSKNIHLYIKSYTDVLDEINRKADEIQARYKNRISNLNGSDGNKLEGSKININNMIIEMKQDISKLLEVQANVDR